MDKTNDEKIVAEGVQVTMLGRAQRPTYAAIASVADGVKENRRSLIAALFLVGCMTCATFGVVIAGNELTKETKVSDEGTLVTVNNAPVSVNVADNKGWLAVVADDPCTPDMMGAPILGHEDTISMVTACSKETFTTPVGTWPRSSDDNYMLFVPMEGAEGQDKNKCHGGSQYMCEWVLRCKEHPTAKEWTKGCKKICTDACSPKDGKPGNSME